MFHLGTEIRVINGRMAEHTLTILLNTLLLSRVDPSFAWTKLANEIWGEVITGAPVSLGGTCPPFLAAVH